MLDFVWCNSNLFLQTTNKRLFISSRRRTSNWFTLINSQFSYFQKTKSFQWNTLNLMSIMNRYITHPVGIRSYLEDVKRLSYYSLLRHIIIFLNLPCFNPRIPRHDSAIEFQAFKKSFRDEKEINKKNSDKK